jgi:hypothetical protein
MPATKSAPMPRCFHSLNSSVMSLPVPDVALHPFDVACQIADVTNQLVDAPVDRCPVLIGPAVAFDRRGLGSVDLLSKVSPLSSRLPIAWDISSSLVVIAPGLDCHRLCVVETSGRTSVVAERNQPFTLPQSPTRRY